jgi:GNAT superfamily N-acetyltransferase
MLHRAAPRGAMTHPPLRSRMQDTRQPDDDGVLVQRLAAGDAHARIPALTEVLIDCVDGGASVSFMLPMTPEKATRFWEGVAEGVARGERVLLVADERDGRLLGTVQVVLALPENQPHRAEVAKMLVHRRARRRGVARRLLEAAEAAARDAGKSLLVLDTVTGSDAERLYARAGWQRVGEIPSYALMPDGPACATTIFYKAI